MGTQKKKEIKELRILVGLPASGKTTFASKFKPQILDNNPRNEYADIVDFDEIYKAANKKTDEEKKMKLIKDMALINLYYKILIIDGLFLTQNDVEWVLDLYLNSPEYANRYDFKKIIIDYWIPDIDGCLWNDQGRRAMTSEWTIKHAKLEKINHKKIAEKFGIPTKLEQHVVVWKPKYQIFVEENDIKNVQELKYLMSNTWSLGGEAWGWDGSKRPMSSEQPLEFDELDNLLEKICPTITFLQYKKLYKNCVTLEERDTSDYYSRSTEAFWSCDLEKLWNMLEDMGLIH